MSHKVRVWFNRWFAVGYHYMNNIRHNPDGLEFEIYGTHRDAEHVSFQACDYTEIEPALPGDEYVAYCLDFCKRHKIDVFVPRWRMINIVRAIDSFEAIGVKVVACTNLELLDVIEDKGNFYRSVEQNGLMVVPEYHLVHNVAEFKQAYDDLTSKGLGVCFKPTRSEGGLGFRVIQPNYNALEELLDVPNVNISYEQTVQILSSIASFPELMVMEVLEGHEYSIDCLASPTGELLAAVPRRKADGGRARLLENVPELIRLAEEVAQFYKIPYNYNLQLKYQGDIPKVLEINPRMSGGLHISCLSGVDFPYLAVKLALGHAVEKQNPEFGILASYVEQPVLIRKLEQS